MDVILAELHRVQKQLSTEQEARAYCETKASEYAYEMSRLKTTYEKDIADLRLQHANDQKAMLAENNKLRSRVEELERAAMAKENTVKSLEQEKIRLDGFTKHDSRTVQGLTARSKNMHRIYEKSEEPTAMKRGSPSANPEDAPPTKKPRTPRIVPCTQCSSHGWQCDNNTPCEHCIRRNKHSGCKRVMCKTFGTAKPCTNRDCAFAHEDDKFTALVPFTRVKQRQGGPSPTHKAAEEKKASGKEKEEIKTGSLKKGVMQTVYDAMFERLPKHNGRADGGDGPDDPTPA